MTILAIDTSTDYLSLAVMRHGRVAGRYHRKAKMRHSSTLVPAIGHLLKRCGLKIGQIDCFAISAGPGSFTGLRIGVTTVKGLAYAGNKSVVAVPTLDAIAENAKDAGMVVCPVLDARKGKVYAAFYRPSGRGGLKKISGYLLITPAELAAKASQYEAVTYLTDAPQLISAEPSKRDWHPDAATVARLAAVYLKAGKTVSAEELQPMYLYSKECDIRGR